MTPTTFPARSRRIRILFVGEIHSSHARSWIRLLDSDRFDVRCFQTTMLALPYGGRFEYPTYMPFAVGEDDDPAKIQFSIGARLKIRLLRRQAADYKAQVAQLEHIGLACRLRRLRLNFAWRWLAEIIGTWRPDIVHTFGLTEGAAFLATAANWIGPRELGRWVMQLRGGSDLALNHADPEAGPRLAKLAARGDAIVTDNQVNFEYLEKLGTRIPESRKLIVPGTGGVNVDQLASRWKHRTRERRLILWPKAYESPWSKALPVLEAIRNVWGELGRCRIQILASDAEIPKWINLMPRAMAQAFTLHQRIPHEHVMEKMLEARVMLAPSLIDGTPNTMWEAMACGAVPIVSPLPTITAVAEAGRNALFARNLYPEEIGAQLVRAMSDDELVERISGANLQHVRRLADRAVVGPKLDAFYRSLL